MLIALCALGGCHLIAGHTAVQHGDAAVDAAAERGPHDAGVEGSERGQDGTTDTPLDAADAGPDMIDPLAPFGAPVKVTGINSPETDNDPTLTGDMLEIYFAREGDIWRSSRGSVGDPWPAPAPAPDLNTTVKEVNPELSLDGLTITFASDRSGGTLDLYTSARIARTSAWSTPQLIAELSSTGVDTNASVTEDGLTVVFASIRGGNSYDLYISTRPSTADSWSDPQPLDVVNSAVHDFGPWINAPGTLICFVSYRTPPDPRQPFWIASRPDAASPFSAPQPLVGLDTRPSDEDPWLSQDLKTLYFASGRDGNLDIFVATR